MPAARHPGVGSKELSIRGGVANSGLTSTDKDTIVTIQIKSNLNSYYLGEPLAVAAFLTRIVSLHLLSLVKPKKDAGETRHL